MRSGRPKGRSNTTYQHKVNKIKKWYEKRVKNRELAKDKIFKKDLKPLDFYIDQIKKPNKDR